MGLLYLYLHQVHVLLKIECVIAHTKSFFNQVLNAQNDSNHSEEWATQMTGDPEQINGSHDQAEVK
jgi:hypothetical protein